MIESGAVAVVASASAFAVAFEFVGTVGSTVAACWAVLASGMARAATAAATAIAGSPGAPASGWEDTVGSHFGRVAGIHLVAGAGAGADAGAVAVAVAVAVAAAAGAAAVEAHTECIGRSHRPAVPSCSADPCCQAPRRSAVTGSRYRGRCIAAERRGVDVVVERGSRELGS